MEGEGGTYSCCQASRFCVVPNRKDIYIYTHTRCRTRAVATRSAYSTFGIGALSHFFPFVVSMRSPAVLRGTDAVTAYLEVWTAISSGVLSVYGDGAIVSAETKFSRRRVERL